MHSPVTLGEACRRALEQIDAAWQRQQEAQRDGGRRSTVTDVTGLEIEVLIPLADEKPYEASCACMDDGLDLVYVDGAPHRALCPRCTAAEKHKDAEGNYLATALETLLFSNAPVSSPPSPYHPEERREQEEEAEPLQRPIWDGPITQDSDE